MKVTLYMDVEPWMDEDFAFVAWAKPSVGPMPPDRTRYKFSVEIPNPTQAVDLGIVEAAVEEGGQAE